MNIHVCKQCGSHFVYCRACVFRPIRYKDNGFCSKECYEASKNVVVPVIDPEIIEEAVIEEIQLPDEIIEDVEPVEEEAPTETVVEETVSIETPTEVIAVTEPTIKKETNANHKKKKKH